MRRGIDGDGLGSLEERWGVGFGRGGIGMVVGFKSGIIIVPCHEHRVRGRWRFDLRLKQRNPGVPASFRIWKFDVLFFLVY